MYLKDTQNTKVNQLSPPMCWSLTAASNSLTVIFLRLETFLCRPRFSVWTSANGVFRLKELELIIRLDIQHVWSALFIFHFIIRSYPFTSKILKLCKFFFAIYLNKERAERSLAEFSVSSPVSVSTHTYMTAFLQKSRSVYCIYDENFTFSSFQ